MSTAAPRFWSSGALRSAGSLVALHFEVGCSSGIVGDVLVIGFVLGKISATLGKVSAILVLCRLGSISAASCGRLVVDLGAAWAVLGCFGKTWAASWDQLGGPSWSRFERSWDRLGSSLGATWAQSLAPSGRLGRVMGASWGRLGSSY